MRSVVSVIMPAWNAAGTIVEAIESVLQQSFSDLELIVVDDGSTDDTADQVRSMHDPRLALLSIPHSGVGAARNRGVAAACGDYISFLDADDIWLPDKLEVQVELLEAQPAAGAVYGFVDKIDADGTARRPIFRQVAEGWILETLLVWNLIANGSNLLVRRHAFEQVGGFDESLEAAEDWDLSIRLARVCEFVCVPRTLVLYRQGANTLSTRVHTVERSYRRALERVYGDVPSDLQRLRPLSLAVFYQYLATKAWERNRRWGVSALRYAAKSVYYAEQARNRSEAPPYYPFASQESMRENVRPAKAALRMLFSGGS